MKYKGYLMIVIIVLVLNLIGCTSPGQLGDEKPNGFLEEEQVVYSFSEFAPDFTSILAGDIENLTGKAEDNRIGEPRSTTIEMKQKSTYSGWDFDHVWAIQEEISYPYLRW
ncbi:MAG: hypothetical protein ACOCQN_00735 [Halanaerobiaceae bacterium]